MMMISLQAVLYCTFTYKHANIKVNLESKRDEGDDFISKRECLEYDGHYM